MKRVVAIWLLASVALVGAVRVAIAVPESCRPPTAIEVDDAIAGAVGWFATNQREDGRWVYRYDTLEPRDLGGYEWVRHAGVLLSLEQAASRARPVVAQRAAVTADAGWRAIERQYRNFGTGEPSKLAVDGTSSVTGGAALTGIALAERRLRKGDVSLDPTLLAFARFVAAQVQRDGSVLNRVNMETGIGVAESYSPFATGQALFLLASVRAITGTREFDEEIARIIAYVSTERAAREGFVPDVSDHWSAYAMQVLEADAPGFLSDLATIAFVRKQIGITGVQVRYESQRTNSHLNRWTRGRQTLGAGLGTLGEALGAWRRVVPNHPALAKHSGWLDERLACVAGLLVERQITDAEARLVAGGTVARGAWTQFGITQMDDQQHALSALLAARDIDLDAPNAPRRSPVPEHAWLAVLLAIAVLNPARLVRRHVSCDGTKVSIVGVAVLGTAAALGGPLIRAIDVSAATAAVGAGCAVVVASLASLIVTAFKGENETASRTDLLLNGLLRPETLLLAVAFGAGGWGWEWSLATALVVAVATTISSPLRVVKPNVHAWASTLFACCAIALGIALVVDAAYAV